MQVEGQRRLGSGALILLIIILCFFPPLSTDMFLSDMPNMAVELHTDASTMNMVLYGCMLSLAVSILVFGPVTDRYGRRPVLFFALVEYIVVSLIGSVVDNIYVLVVIRVLQGIGSGAAMTVSTALIKDCFTGPRMQKVLSISAVMGVLAPLVAPILGAWIISISSWRWTLVAPTILGAICLVMTFALTETVSDEKRATASVKANFRAIGVILSDKAFTAFLFIATALNGAFMAYLSVSSYIYEESFGCSSMVYSLYLAAALILGTLFMFVVNRVWSIVGNVKAIGIYVGLALFSGVIMYLFGGVSDLVFLLTFLPCVTATSAIRPFGMGIIMGSRDGDNGLVSALINFMMFAFGVIGMVVSTMFPDYIKGLATLMFVFSAIYIAAWLCLRHMGYEKLRGLKLQ